MNPQDPNLSNNSNNVNNSGGNFINQNYSGQNPNDINKYQNPNSGIQPQNYDYFGQNNFNNSTYQQKPKNKLFIYIPLALIIGLLGGMLGGVLVNDTFSFDNQNNSTELFFSDTPINAEDGVVTKVVKEVSSAVVKIEVFNQTQTSGSSGSGAVIDSSKGYILTNNHVISAKVENPSYELAVTFSNNEVLPARIVGTDFQTDLAVIKVEASNLKSFTMGDSSKLQVGQDVIAIGSPLSLDQTVTTGIISSLNRVISMGDPKTSERSILDAIQTDAAINPGNSGGPLLDYAGRLIGITSAAASTNESGGSIGLGFAIPINDAREIAQQLINTGKVKHPSIGVTAKPGKYGNRKGVEIVSVTNGGPADKAGIEKGDLIIETDGKKISSAEQLIVLLRKGGLDVEHTLKILRNGKEISLNVKTA